VRVGRRRGSIGAQRALGRGPRSPEALDAVLVALVDRVSHRLRIGRRLCRTVMLRLRFDDFARITRSQTLREATSSTKMILEALRELLASARPTIEERGATLVGVSLGNLVDDGVVQLALPLDERRASALDGAVDDVRDRFGTSAITRGVLVGRDPGLVMPVLPD
jgi:DNA polymerase-4